MTNNKKILIASIVAVVLATIGISYAAFFAYSRAGTENNKLVTGDIYFKYGETTNMNISNLMPSASYPAKATNNYFEFTITGKNTSSKAVTYTIKLNKGSVPSGKNEANRLTDSHLKFKLVEVTNPGASETETAKATDQSFASISNSTLYSTTIPANTSSYTKTYRLYARVAETVTIGTGGTYSISAWNAAFASVKVDVTASA